MPYTDIELNKLKKWLAEHPYEDGDGITIRQAKDLIARLEAAERVCETTRRWLCNQGDQGDIDLALIAWHKAAGK